MSLCSQFPEWRPLYDYWPPWRNSVHLTVQNERFPTYIIHPATETRNWARQMNKRSILRDLLWPIYKSDTSNEVWISDTPPRWPHRQNNWSCTPYGQAPAVALAWDWPREDAYTQQAQNICITFIQGWTNVKDVGPTLHKCYTNILCLVGNVLITSKTFPSHVWGYIPEYYAAEKMCIFEVGLYCIRWL